MKVWKIALLLTLAVALVLGVALPGLAAPDETAPQVEWKPPHPRVLKGVVDSIGDESFTINPGEREIRVNEGTRFFRVSVPRKLVALFRHRIAQMGAERQEQQGKIRAMVQRIPGLKAEGRLPVPRRVQPFNRPELLPEIQEALRERQEALRERWEALREKQEAEVAPAGEGNEKPKRLQGYLKWLRQFGEEVGFEDIAEGDRVVMWVVPNEGEPLAKLVLIMTPAAYKRIVGTIAEDGIDESEMTITVNPLSDTEDEMTLLYDDGTIFVLRGTPSLKDGMKVVVIYVEEGDDLLAKRVMAGVKLPELNE